MKKRKFSAGSIFILYIILAIISMAIFFAFKKYSSLASIIIGILGMFVEYAICRGLIVNRMGSVEDYLMQVKEVNLNFFIVNILFSGLGFLITMLFAGSMLPLLSQLTRGNFSSIALVSSGFGMMGLAIILSVFLTLISSYKNFVVSDPRNKELEVMDSFKKVFSTGFSLLGNTFISLLKYLVLPVIVFTILIVFIGISTLSENSYGGGIIVILLLIFIFSIVYVYLMIKFKAELSDHYLNLYGDYQITYKDESDEDLLKLTREVEVDPEDVSSSDLDHRDDYEN